MARWVGMVGLEPVGFVSFVVVVACVLAVVALVAVLYAMHFYKEEKTHTTYSRSNRHMDQPTCNFMLPPISPYRAILNSLSGPKKLLLRRKWVKSEEKELEAYDSMVTEKGIFCGREVFNGGAMSTPDFSGIIIYDDKGNHLPHLPLKSLELNIFHPSLEVEAQH